MGKSKKVSDENNVANKRCAKKLFAPSSKGKNQFIPIGGDTTALEKKALSSLFPPTEHEVLSSGVNGFSSIGGERETAVEQTAAPHQNRVNSSD